MAPMSLEYSLMTSGTRGHQHKEESVDLSGTPRLATFAGHREPVTWQT